ncbi:MAG: putative cytokinetic ring protein SteA, partial [Solirubrobacterales bacterium]
MASLVRIRRGPLNRNGRSGEEPGVAIHGSARLGRRTKELVRRLGASDVAIIDHEDLDRVAAEDLVETGVPAVVNVSRSSTGRYPNAGPLLLAQAGVRLIDAPAAPLFEALREGDPVTVVGGEVRRNGTVVASGRVLGAAELAAELAEQRRRVDEALRAFAENTMDRIREEGELLGGEIELPAVRTAFRDRHVLIVVRGTTYRKDLRALRA